MEELHACSNFSVLRLWDFNEDVIANLTEVLEFPTAFVAMTVEISDLLLVPECIIAVSLICQEDIRETLTDLTTRVDKQYFFMTLRDIFETPDNSSIAGKFPPFFYLVPYSQLFCTFSRWYRHANARTNSFNSYRSSRGVALLDNGRKPI